MTFQKAIGLLILGLGIVYGAAVFVQAARNRAEFRSERGSLPLLGLIEACLYFCATMGLPDFLLNTLAIRHLDLTEDRKLPGTLIAASITPGAVIAFSLLRADYTIELPTLVCCCASILAGAFVGSRFVRQIAGNKIRKIMGIALIFSMGALVLRIIIARGATGTAAGLPLPLLIIACAGSFCWGIFNMLGIPMKAPGSALFLLLGLSPLSALTLVLVLGFLGPMGGGFQVLRDKRYHQKITCASVVFGSIGALIGCLVAISVSPLVLNILLFAAMLLAIITLLRK